MKTSEFVYELPQRLIAQAPVEPRDSARLIRASDLSDWTIRDLPSLLEPGDLVVVNETRVRAARLRGRRAETGGAVELLLLGRVGDRWEVLLKPARRLKVGTVIEFARLSARLETDPVDGKAVVSIDSGGGAIEDVIAEEGEMPLPPYIHETLGDAERYQTVFSQRVGSAAAPTAGLHFTTALFDDLAALGVDVARVELQVGLDTFRPITVDDIVDHEIHSEWISVSPDTVEAVERTKAAGGRVVAIGTTTVRALESAAASGILKPFEGPTRLYITPGYRFRVVDTLLTNFHIPGSSLLVMIAAFAGDGWRGVYQAAIERNYRFLSFGDAMVLERSDGGPRALAERNA